MTTAHTLLAEVAGGLKARQVIPYLGAGVFDLVEGACPIPRSPEELVAALTAKAAVPGRIRRHLTAASQYIESHKHRRTLETILTGLFKTGPEPTALHRYLAGIPELPLIVDTVLELLRLEAERQQLRVELALAPGLPQVYADRVMIEQVLLNLVKNAIEAMREVPAARRGLRIEGRVNLDGEVEVRVCDRGPGLSEAESAQLFSPFYTTKSDGLGIGLAICRSIIEYHEGRLFFEARDGGGSVFGFTLPPPDRRI